MEPEKATVLPLHKEWKYLETCCELINEEWPRSAAARMHSLKASCDKLPTSLILIHNVETNEELVIGHSKITPIPRYSSACFVESVVISRKFRGKGWGRYIMQETEKFAKMKGKTSIFLSTTDKEEFYAKLGYCKCEPISIYGCNTFQIKNMFTLPPSLSLNGSNKTELKPIPGPAPPPPLPPTNKSKFSTKVYMMKTLT